MDPVSHLVTGLAIAKLVVPLAGCGRTATAAFVIGSLMPDADIMLQRWGDYAYLKNHRGPSHSILGLLAGSLLTGLVLAFAVGGIDFSRAFLFCLAGGTGHVIFDMLNSYGAGILWPLSNKKYALSILPIFDPFVVGSLIGYIAAPTEIQAYFFAAGLLYIASRALMRMIVQKRLFRKFRKECRRIFILPSTTRLFRWHFVIDKNGCSIVGEASTFFRKIKIFMRLEKIEETLAEKVAETAVGKFFKEFTPIYHVTCRKIGDGILEFMLIDMRYFLRNNFLHHATAILDKEFKPLKELFQPYSLSRKIEI